MEKENLKVVYTSQLEKKLQTKEVRLAPSIRKYIRRLKQSGKWDEAIKLGQIKREQKRTTFEYATEELDKSITEIICTDDPVEEAAKQIKTVWLLNATGELSQKEREDEMERIFSGIPAEVQTSLEERMPAIRDAVKRFMPLAG